MYIMIKWKNDIRNFKWFRNIVAQMKIAIVPGLEGIPLYLIVKVFAREITNGKLIDRAASISFFFLLAIPPTFIFLFTLLPFFHLGVLENTLFGLIKAIAPNKNTYNLLKKIIFDLLHTHRNGLLSFGFILGIFSSTSGVLGIMRSFDKNHSSFKRRNFFQKRLVALKITSWLVTLFITSLLLILAQNIVFDLAYKWIGFHSNFIRFVVGFVRWIIIIVLFFTMFSLVYTYGPSVKKRWRFLSIGSTIATTLTILTTLGFSYYVNHFNSYNRIYGSIGTVLVVMIWIYLNSLVLLIGFELNASIRIVQAEQIG